MESKPTTIPPSNPEADKLQSALNAIKEEFPHHGLFLIAMDAHGSFNSTGTIRPAPAAALLDHVAKHLRGECKC
jgi:hypothetical protein